MTVEKIYAGNRIKYNLQKFQAFSVAETSMKVLLEERKVAKRKTTDPLGAKTMFYYARAHELSGSSAPIRKSLLEVNCIGGL